MTYWRQQRHDDGGLWVFPPADRYFEGALTLPLNPGTLRFEVAEVCSILWKALG